MLSLHSVIRRFRSDFVRHVGIYATGVTVSQVLAIALTPLLSRLYAPEMFGALGVFAAIITLFTVFATLRYEQAILLPASEKEALILLLASLILTTIFAGLFLVFVLSVVWILPQWVFFDEGWRVLMFWLPLGGVLAAYNACLTEWQIRRRAFGDISRATIVQALTNAVVAIGFIFAFPAQGRFGLIAALLASLLTGTAVLLVGALRMALPEGQVSVRDMLAVLGRYRKFPYFSLPGDLINSLATQLPLLLINRLFDMSAAGNFSVAVRLLYVPSRLIGKAVRDVFRNRAAQEARGPGGCRTIFTKSALVLGAAAGATMLPIMVAAPDIFAFVLGQEWRQAAEIAQIIAPMAALAFVASPLGWLTYLYEKQHVDMLWQIGLLLAGVIAGVVGFMTHDILLTVGVWSAGGTLLYLVYIWMSYRLSGIQLQDRASS